MKHRVLVIEDNRDIADLLAIHLRDMGADVVIAREGKSGLQLALGQKHDLIILDLMLPGMDGLEICKRLRSEPNYTPILMLTAKGTELDRVLGLEIGADDYLTKPFSIRELLARVKALLRRAAAYSSSVKDVADSDPDGVLKMGDLQIDSQRRQVTLRGNLIELTAKEFDLLRYFAKQPGRVFTRGQLLNSVWGYGHEGYEHTVNSHINRLRAKIEEDPSHPHYVLTVWGVGYKFIDAGNV